MLAWFLSTMPSRIHVLCSEFIHHRPCVFPSWAISSCIMVLKRKVTSDIFPWIMIKNWSSSATMWKLQNFMITQILREITFGDCRSAKSAILTHFKRLWILIFMKFCSFWRLKFTKVTNFRAPKMAKAAFLDLQNSPKVISRKIWMTEKTWNFPTVLPQCGNYRMLLLLRFYVKSKWANLDSQNLPFYTFRDSEVWFLWIFELLEGWNLPNQ